MKDYYLINEIAKAHGITKRTLDYYDKIDLLKPDAIAENGYRMYSFEKFQLLQGILLWKMMGLDSSEIKEIIREKSPRKMKEIIQNRKKKLQDQIEKLLVLEKNLDIVDKRIDKLFSVEANKIEIKYLEEEQVMILKNTGGSVKDSKAIGDIGARFFNIFSKKKLVIIENGFIFSKENIENKSYSDFDKCYLVFLGKMEEIQQVKIKAGQYVCMWYCGKISKLDEGIKRVCNWISENGYVINGDVIVTEHLSTLYNYKEDDLTGQIKVPIKKQI